LDLPAGTYDFRATAIDIYGNRADSDIERVTRGGDVTPPDVPVFRLEGTLVDGAPVAGEPFAVVADFSDTGSGIALATLSRDGAVRTTAVVSGELRIDEPGLGEGESVVYRAVARDRAGLVSSNVLTGPVGANALPTLLVSAPSEVREREAFVVNVDASDDVALARVELTWNGVTTTRPLAGTSAEVVELISEFRSERVSGSLAEDLEVRVFDALGQSASQLVPITVVEDRDPTLAGVTCDVPASGFYGDNLTVTVDGLESADDGALEEMSVSFVDVSSGPARIVRFEEGRASLTPSLITQPSRPEGESYRLFVRVEDRLGTVV